MVLKSHVDGPLFTIFHAILSVCWRSLSRSIALIFLRTTWEGFQFVFWFWVLKVLAQKLKYWDNWKSKINTNGPSPRWGRCWNKPSVNSMVGEVGALFICILGLPLSQARRGLHWVALAPPFLPTPAPLVAWSVFAKLHEAFHWGSLMFSSNKILVNKSGHVKRKITSHRLTGFS